MSHPVRHHRSRWGHLSRWVGVGLLAASTLVAACGGDAAEAVPPARVPDDLAPATVLDGLLVIENRDETTLEALASADETSLVSDTRIWEIRRGQRLVGTLQISSVLPNVDLLDESVRDRMVAQMILGQSSRIRVGDVEVFTSTSNDKTVFIWFGEEVFEILQTKDRALDPEALATAIIEYQDGQEGWVPLPQLIEFD